MHFLDQFLEKLFLSFLHPKKKVVAVYFYQCLDVNMLPCFSAVCGNSSPASPEAGAVLDVCSRKQICAATFLGEERRAVL